jgi:transcriptional regulator with XRE-family HTH domain
VVASDPTEAIASRIKTEREMRNWSLADLAERSGVSKAMISKIERNEASPTATVLGRLSGAFGLQLSALLALAERAGVRVSRAADQPVWQDPETGYTRRVISPLNGSALELVTVTLPPGTRVAYPPAAFTFQHQQVWVMSGTLTFEEGDLIHVLEAGDCLELGLPVACAFVNATKAECVYVLGLVKR